MTKRISLHFTSHFSVCVPFLVFRSSISLLANTFASVAQPTKNRSQSISLLTLSLLWIFEVFAVSLLFMTLERLSKACFGWQAHHWMLCCEFVICAPPITPFSPTRHKSYERVRAAVKFSNAIPVRCRPTQSDVNICRSRHRMQIRNSGFDACICGHVCLCVCACVGRESDTSWHCFGLVFEGEKASLIINYDWLSRKLRLLASGRVF